MLARFAALVSLVSLPLHEPGTVVAGMKHSYPQIFSEAVGDFAGQTAEVLKAAANGELGSRLDKFAIDGSDAQRQRPGPEFLKTLDAGYIRGWLSGIFRFVYSRLSFSDSSSTHVSSCAMRMELTVRGNWFGTWLACQPRPSCPQADDALVHKNVNNADALFEYLNSEACTAVFVSRSGHDSWTARTNRFDLGEPGKREAELRDVFRHGEGKIAPWRVFVGLDAFKDFSMTNNNGEALGGLGLDDDEVGETRPAPLHNSPDEQQIGQIAGVSSLYANLNSLRDTLFGNSLVTDALLLRRPHGQGWQVVLFAPMYCERNAASLMVIGNPDSLTANGRPEIYLNVSLAPPLPSFNASFRDDSLHRESPESSTARSAARSEQVNPAEQQALSTPNDRAPELVSVFIQCAQNSSLPPLYEDIPPFDGLAAGAFLSNAVGTGAARTTELERLADDSTYAVTK